MPNWLARPPGMHVHPQWDVGQGLAGNVLAQPQPHRRHRRPVGRDGTRIPADKRAREFKIPAGGVEVYHMDKYAADYNMNHKEDWLQAIKTGKKPCMDIEVGHRVANMNNLGNLSYLLGRPLDWDGAKEQIIDDPLANRMLGRPQRHPYHL